MAELSTLARPYAKAAFEYALDNNQLTQWYEQLAGGHPGVLGKPGHNADRA